MPSPGIVDIPNSDIRKADTGGGREGGKTQRKDPVALARVGPDTALNVTSLLSD